MARPAQPSARQKQPMDGTKKAMNGQKKAMEEFMAMDSPPAGGLETLLLFFDKVIRSLPTLTAPPQAYPSITDPLSGAEVDAGPLAVTISSNRFDLPHVVTLRDPDTLTALGPASTVTFSGTNVGDASVTIPPPGAFDPPTNFLVEVEPFPGNKSSIIVIRKGVTAPAELDVTIEADPGPPFTVGVPVLFTAHVSGGVTPYSYFWSFPAPDEFPDLNPASHTFDTPGTYSVELYVHDETVPSKLAKYATYGPFDVIEDGGS